jgi:hypothetical protein
MNSLLTYCIPVHLVDHLLREHRLLALATRDLPLLCQLKENILVLANNNFMCNKQSGILMSFILR